MSISVDEAVLSRRSVRGFLDKPVPLDVLRRVMDTARWAPSGCNFQPWQASVLTGEPLKALRNKIVNAPPQDPAEYDFSAPGAFPEYRARLQAVAASMYGSMDVERDDAARRQEFMRTNALSFGAPALLLCYFPRFMKEPQWSDVGMWLQTVMLLLRGEGLDSCPQEFMSFYARTIKEHLGVSDETHIFFCGIAIGYRDPDLPVNNFDRERILLDEQVRFLGF